MKLLITVLIIVAILIILWLIYKWVNREIHEIHHLNLQKKGLTHIPAVPYSLNVIKIIQTLTRLSAREKEMDQAQNGLSNTYHIAGHSANGYTYLFGESGNKASLEAKQRLKKSLEHPLLGRKRLEDHIDHVHKHTDAIHVLENKHVLEQLPLEKPDQFALSWTQDGGIYHRAAKDYLLDWSSTLKDVDHATEMFWPNIAQYGLAYNLLILQKIDEAKLSELQKDFPGDWSEEMNALQKEGSLYAIDMRIFGKFEAQQVKGFTRFTPSTFVLLEQDKNSKALQPFAIWVAGYQGADQQFYTAKDNAWLYALQAAKVSVTVFGIWLGHVYHWHMVSAAMQMTRHNTLPKDHDISMLLVPQSNYLIEFDLVLLLLWKNIAPPASFSTSRLFLELSNTYATDRQFFDDDPKTTLSQFGIIESNFSRDAPWDQFPIAGQLLELWNYTEIYVNAFVDHSYEDDQAVFDDQALQTWIKTSSDPKQGNIKGLPQMDSKKALKAVLTSLVYRVTAHGCSRLSRAANPALTFTANFPPCLQNATIPEKDKKIDTTELLAYLPKTGTIGEMIKFYYTFSFSAPYESFLPLSGLETNLFFPNGLNDPRNEALISFRKKIKAFIEAFDSDAPQIHQWPLNIET